MAQGECNQQRYANLANNSGVDILVTVHCFGASSVDYKPVVVDSVWGSNSVLGWTVHTSNAVAIWACNRFKEDTRKNNKKEKQGR